MTMSRRNNQCSEKHTPLSPHKNRIRRNMLRKVGDNTKDIITISHGIFDTCVALGWQGRIQACDIDQGVHNAILFLKEGQNGKPGDYPELKIMQPGFSIQDTVKHYCRQHGVKNLGVVDVDLAVSVKQCWEILRPVLETLVKNKYRGKTFLTFRNGRRDGFGKNAIQARIDWLYDKLPKGVIVGSKDLYRSVRLDPNAKRSVGSAMCIIELQHT